MAASSPKRCNAGYLTVLRNKEPKEPLAAPTAEGRTPDEAPDPHQGRRASRRGRRAAGLTCVHGDMSPEGRLRDASPTTFVGRADKTGTISKKSMTLMHFTTRSRAQVALSKAHELRDLLHRHILP